MKKTILSEEPFEKKYANLHFHTEHSDHLRSVREVIRLGVEEGYQAFGITDHDCVSGWGEMKEACEEFGVDYLLGAEFYGYTFGHPFHLVAFHFDPDHPEMKDLLAYTRRRNTYLVQARFELGVKRGTIRGITWDEVVERNRGIDIFYHGHVTRTMIEKGVLTEEERKDFALKNFDKAYAPVPMIYDPPKVEDIISAIVNAGGIPIMAHPGYQDKQEFMEALIGMGVRGIELWHPQNDALTREMIWDLTKKYTLYIGGGTDHHGHMEGYPDYVPGGENHPSSLPYGMHGVTKEDFLNLKNRIYD